VYVAREPESFKYDTDGNLTNDGRWAYTWDGENRLVAMTTNTLAGPPYHLTFAYDYQGRRIQKTVTTNGVTIASYNYLYDGWNLAAELGSSGTLVRSYVWGTDLSGSQSGAGGVGGLLEISYHGTAITNCFPAFDGNGNIAALINAADGTIAANYEYGPFGEVIRQTDPMAKANPIRFSTKYQDDENDLCYYDHRYYKPSSGTWLSRDPNDERGALLFQHKDIIPKSKDFDPDYEFAYNDPIDNVDYLGFKTCGWNCGKNIDLALSRTYINVAQRYANLSFWGKVRAWSALELPFHLGDAWDYDALTWYWGPEFFGCGSRTCTHTATVAGGCYNVWSINYVAYGWACSLAGISNDDMVEHIIAWKELKGNWEEADQWLAFAEIGRLGLVAAPPPKSWNSSCTPCTIAYQQKTLLSKWPSQ